MTIRLLKPYAQRPVNAITTFAASVEAGLIAAGQASADLTGGVPFFAPKPGLVLQVKQIAVGSVVLQMEEQTTLTLPEGQVLMVTGAASTVGAAIRVGSAEAWSIGAGPLAAIGPYKGAQTFVITCTTGSIATTVQEAVLGAPSGGGATDISFSVAIPLTSGGSAYMPQQNVTGPLAFTPMANAVRDSLVYLRLVANGANVPTFTGFAEWGASMGWDNTNGVVNNVQFFADGYDTYVSITQATVTATAPGDTTAPVRQSATVNGNTLVLAYNEALNTAAPALSSFSYVLNNGAAVNPTAAAVSGQNVTLTFAAGALQGQTAALSYVPGTNPIRDTSGNAAGAFTSITVTNNTPASDTTAPVIQSAAMNGSTLVMTYNEALNTTAPTLSSLLLSLASGAGVSPTAAVVSGATITATFATAATAGQSASLNYAPGASAIRDLAGNNAAALTNYTVTNNTAATGTSAPLQFTANPAYYVEAVDGNGDYTYSSTTGIGSGYQAVASMSAAKSLPAGVDGGFWFTSSNASSLNTLIGFMAGAAAPGQVVFSSWDYSVIDPAVGQAYVTRIKAAQTASSVLKETGDIVGVFLVGGAVIARVARAAAPSTWIDIATIATGVNLKLWPMMQSQQHPAARTFVKPRYMGGLV